MHDNKLNPVKVYGKSIEINLENVYSPINKVVFHTNNLRNGQYNINLYLKSATGFHEIKIANYIAEINKDGTAYSVPVGYLLPAACIRLNILNNEFINKLEAVTLELDNVNYSPKDNKKFTLGTYVENFNQNGLYKFDLGSNYPVEWIKINGLVEDNSKLYIETSSDGKIWNKVNIKKETLIFAQKESTIIYLGHKRFKEAKITMSGDIDQKKSADFYWIADKIIFYAKAAEPYTLLYSSENYDNGKKLQNISYGIIKSLELSPFGLNFKSVPITLKNEVEDR